MELINLESCFKEFLSPGPDNSNSSTIVEQVGKINQLLSTLTEKSQGLGQLITTPGQHEEVEAEGEAAAVVGEGGPQKFRESIPETIFTDLTFLSKKLEKSSEFKTNTNLSYEFYIQLFRFGRNIGVYCERNQDLMYDSKLVCIPINFLDEVIREVEEASPNENELLEKVKSTKADDAQIDDANVVPNCQISEEKESEKNEDDKIRCIRLALQMISNSLMGNAKIAKKLVTQLDLLDLIIAIASTFDDSLVVKYSSMVGYALHEMVGYNENTKKSLIPKGLKLFLEKSDEHHFMNKWFLKLISTEQFIPVNYNELDGKLNVQLLARITKHGYSADLHSKTIIFFMELFKRIASTIISCDLEDMEKVITLELNYLVQLFCGLIGSTEPDSNLEINMDRMDLLISDDDFVILLNRLLKAVHLAGNLKDKNVKASRIETLDSLAAMKDLSIQSLPKYSFKSNLIRLIGTLSFRNKSHQAKALELDTLSVILECTRIDGFNPFITQCSVFALKCLLEDNAKNQEFVKNVSEIKQ